MMDLYTFIAAMTEYLAWPVTTLILLLVVLLRLPKLAKFIKAIRYKDIEVVMREDFADARLEAERIAIERDDAEVAATSTDKFLKILEVSPTIAVVESWQRLDQAIIKLIQHNGLMQYTTPVAFVEELTRVGELSEGDVRLYRKLRKIRNGAVHAHEGDVLSKAEALEFSEFVELLIGKINEIRNRPGYIKLGDLESE